jgi:hypothetical protein
MNVGRMGRGFGKLGAPVKQGEGGGVLPSTAGEPIGLLLALTKAS